MSTENEFNLGHPGKEIGLRPKCRSCGRYMELRHLSGGSNEMERWLGVWYDHPVTELGASGIGHASSTLYPSPELLAQYAALERGEM